MSNLIFSPLAISDINRIWDYTAENWGVDQADVYTDAIRDNCNDLAKGQKHGLAVSVRNGYLKHQSGKHFIFYINTETATKIIPILHQSMDTERHLKA